MGDFFEWWWKGGSWYDLQQEEQLASLSASHSQATSRLRSQLRQEAARSEDLGTRLGKLEDAVVAMVELEDLRGVMDNFSDAVGTRTYARDVLAKIPALGRVPRTQTPQVPPDVPGYWLHPAVRAVDARLRGDAAGEAAGAEEARRRDPDRTAQFFAAVALLLGSSVAEEDLARLWPTSAQVSQYQRSLWLAVARGGLGEEARLGLVSALRTALTTVPEEEPDTASTLRVRMPLRPARRETARDVVLAALRGPARPADAAASAQALARLRERVESAVAAPPTSGVPEDVPSVPDGVPDLLAQVVSAGAPAEEPLVARIIEIRKALAAIGATTSIAAPAVLNEQSLDVLELLRGDLAESADPAARVVAMQVLAEPILELADELAAAGAGPVAETAEVRVPGGMTVTVSASGPVETGWVATVRERVRAGAPDQRGPIVELAIGGLLAVGGLALAVAVHPGWVVLLVLGLGIVGHGVWQLRQRRTDLADRLATTLAAADRTIAERTQQLQGELLELQTRAGLVPEHVRAIRAALG